MNDLKKEASNSADVITFISNDGDNKFDLAIVNPMIEFGKVTYVGEDEITLLAKPMTRPRISFPTICQGRLRCHLQRPVYRQL